MSMKTKQRTLLTLIALNLALIWGNSLMTGLESGDLSGGIVEFLGKLIPWLATEAGHTFIRKAAHFSEFCLLGLLMSGYRLSCGTRLSPALLGLGLATACIDETIQIFVPGRGSSLIDVWIDTAGFTTGLALVLILHTLRTSAKRN